MCVEREKEFRLTNNLLTALLTFQCRIYEFIDISNSTVSVDSFFVNHRMLKWHLPPGILKMSQLIVRVRGAKPNVDRKSRSAHAQEKTKNYLPSLADGIFRYCVRSAPVWHR